MSGSAFQRVAKLLDCISNIIFNFLTDTIILSHNINSSVQIKVPMLKSGLTWWTDKYVKFQNPSSKNLADEFRGKIHTVAQYTYLLMKTLFLTCGKMFMNPPSLSPCWLLFVLTLPTTNISNAHLSKTWKDWCPGFFQFSLGNRQWFKTLTASAIIRMNM